VSVRHNHLVVAAAAITAAALLAAWFPWRTLLGQSAQLNAASHQISTLNAQSRQLAAEQQAMSTDRAETILAREEYQLVLPGQRLIQILSNPTNGSVAGDPGLQPLVSPSNVKNLVPIQPSAPPPVAASGFWARVERTLEFWR
jgi:outer membrane murein-binding lipoprotein Lpp